MSLIFLTYVGYAMKLFDLPIVKIPLLNVSSDPLDVLVVGLALRMKQLARTNAEFMELVYDRKFCLQIAHDGGMARQIMVDHGKISTQAGQTIPADFILQFADSELGIKTLLKGDPTAFITGMQTGSIKMEGDFALLVWFNQVAKLIPPHIPEPVKTTLQRLAQRIKNKRS